MTSPRSFKLRGLSPRQNKKRNWKFPISISRQSGRLPSHRSKESYNEEFARCCPTPVGRRKARGFRRVRGEASDQIEKTRRLSAATTAQIVARPSQSARKRRSETAATVLDFGAHRAPLQ